MDENYLAKWLSGELGESDLEAFREQPEFETYSRIIRAVQDLEGPAFDTEAALERLLANRSASAGTQPVVDSPVIAREVGKPAEQGKVIRMRPVLRWMAAAAAVVLMLSVGFLYFNSLDETVEAQYAQHQEIALPDASEVLLNAGSRLSYNEKRWDQERNVQLKGEAYFKVAKGRKFSVETEAGTVTVLGTEFNVQQREGVFIVTCYEGRVRVDHQGKAIDLTAGTAYRVVGPLAFKTEEVKSGHPAWTRDESAFRSMPFAFVIEEFQRQYNVKVTASGFDLGERFTGIFSNTDMDLALQSISAPLQLTYEVEGNNVLIYAADTP